MNSENESRLYIKCLNNLCLNLDQFCNLTQQPIDPINQSTLKNQLKPKNESFKQLHFKDKQIKFNHIISEDFLERLSDLGKLNDLTVTLFNNQQTCLKKVCIKNASLSKESIKSLLRQHQLSDILINNIQLNTKELEINSSGTNVNHNNSNSAGNGFNINNLIDGLNEWSLIHLKHLNVSRNASLFSSILINFKQLKNLFKLNVSYTCFNKHSLEIIAQDLGNLEYLDISGTRVSDLEPLLRLKDKLKYLYMYNMRSTLNNDIIEVVCSLHKIQHLDLSCEVSNRIFADRNFSLFDVNLLLDQLVKAKLPDLKYLDVSGKNEINQESIV